MSIDQSLDPIAETAIFRFRGRGGAIGESGIDSKTDKTTHAKNI